MVSECFIGYIVTEDECSSLFYRGCVPCNIPVYYLDDRTALVGYELEDFINGSVKVDFDKIIYAIECYLTDDRDFLQSFNVSRMLTVVNRTREQSHNLGYQILFEHKPYQVFVNGAAYRVCASKVEATKVAQRVVQNACETLNMFCAVEVRQVKGE